MKWVYTTHKYLLLQAIVSIATTITPVYTTRKHLLLQASAYEEADKELVYTTRKYLLLQALKRSVLGVLFKKGERSNPNS